MIIFFILWLGHCHTKWYHESGLFDPIFLLEWNFKSGRDKSMGSNDKVKLMDKINDDTLLILYLPYSCSTSTKASCSRDVEKLRNIFPKLSKYLVSQADEGFPCSGCVAHQDQSKTYLNHIWKRTSWVTGLQLQLYCNFTPDQYVVSAFYS